MGRTEDEAFGRDIGASNGGGGGCTCLKTLFSDEKPMRIFPGGLSVSRTIGDIALKATQLIVAEPELTVHQLTLEDSAVILACDGVWDVMNDSQAADLVRQHLDDPTRAARLLSFEAYRRGSKDNISVVVVALNWVRASAAELAVHTAAAPPAHQPQTPMATSPSSAASNAAAATATALSPANTTNATSNLVPAPNPNMARSP